MREFFMPVILQLAGVEKTPDDSDVIDEKEPAVFFQYQRPVGTLERIASTLGLDPTPWDRTLTGIRTAKGKWIRASDGRHQAFDTLADPGEQQNFYIEGTDIPSPWQEMASRLEVRLPPGADQAQDGALDDITPATRERLRSLGYLD